MTVGDPLATALARDAGIHVPLICGAMYPCSNPELVAAVSEAGGIGIVQPVSLTYVHGYDYREGLRYIRSASAVLRTEGFLEPNEEMREQHPRIPTGIEQARLGHGLRD